MHDELRHYIRRVSATPNPLQTDLDHVTAHVGDLWEALRGRRIFITGGTGFFGRWLLESFVDANRQRRLGARAVVLSRNPAAFATSAPALAGDPGIDFVVGDVRHLGADILRSQLVREGDKFDFVIHAATEASAQLNSENPLLMVDTIVQGTRAALDFAVRTSARRFLHTSSGAIYGQQPSDLTHVDEDHCGGPDPSDAASAYGEGKRLAELLCACFHKQHGIEPVIARCFAFVGPFLPLDAHFAVGNFIRDALRGGPIRIRGDGAPFRSYLYAADLAIWLWTLLFKGKPCRAYNVGSEDGRSILRVADAVAATNDPPLAVSVDREPVPGLLPSRYVPQTERARRELGLCERVSLHEAIERTIRFHRRQTCLERGQLPDDAPKM